MRPSTAVGIAMMLVLPVGLVFGAFVGSTVDKGLGAVLILLGFFPGLGLAFFGYRVIRGSISLSELPGLFLVLAIFFVVVFVMANCPAQR